MASFGYLEHEFDNWELQNRWHKIGGQFRASINNTRLKSQAWQSPVIGDIHRWKCIKNGGIHLCTKLHNCLRRIISARVCKEYIADFNYKSLEISSHNDWGTTLCIFWMATTSWKLSWNIAVLVADLSAISGEITFPSNNLCWPTKYMMFNLITQPSCLLEFLNSAFFFKARSLNIVLETLTRDPC